MDNRQVNINRFEAEMAKVTRDGVDKLMAFIRKSDMYAAPASTRFHLSVTGGLLQHSLNVLDALRANLTKNDDGTYSYEVAGVPAARVTEENVIIMALLHDICKTYFYTTEIRNRKVNGKWEQYEAFAVDDKIPYPDPTAEEAIRHVMRGGKLDYTSFRTYEELQDYTIKHNKGINTREAADKFIREKMPKESYFQKKILDWIKDNAPNAIAWKEAAGPYSRQGIPDITCIINGRYYGFEVKRPFIGVLSKIQEQTIKQIRRAGGRAWVVTSEKEVAEILLPELTQK